MIGAQRDGYMYMKHHKHYLCVPQATAKGYIECPLRAVFDWGYPTSKLRRGRVQGGGKISPALTCNSGALLAFVAYDTD